MFGRKHKGRRSPNILFVIFRLGLSMMMFAVLLGGIYSAYKHFSGIDPFKLNPQAVVLGIMSKNKDIGTIVSKIPGLKEKLDVRSSKIDQDGGGLKLENLTSNIQSQNPSSKLLFSFMLVTDSHNDHTYLGKALAQAKEKDPNLKFVIGLGDYTDVGTIEELREVKKEFDKLGLRYFLVPGDHDLWDSRNKSLAPNSNFREVFGLSYQSFNFNKHLFILLYNSDNYLGMGEEQLKWLSLELQKAKEEGVQAIYIFVHEPLSHPSSDHVMGRVEKKLKDEARSMTYILKNAGVKKIFAGDIHYFTEYVDPETNIPMVTIGAITTQRNAQAPRYSLVKVYEDGNTRVEDIEVN